ncbi:MAG: patatin-like phospholipase family protein, partial [Roseomonas sp.]|nr:patatin-like phospholipase family protein [Roseomonas sp.]
MPKIAWLIAFVVCPAPIGRSYPTHAALRVQSRGHLPRRLRIGRGQVDQQPAGQAQRLYDPLRPEDDAANGLGLWHAEHHHIGGCRVRRWRCSGHGALRQDGRQSLGFEVPDGDGAVAALHQAAHHRLAHHANADDGSRRCAERTIRAMQPWSGAEWPVDRFGTSGLTLPVARATNSSPTSRASRRRLLGVTLGIGAATLLPGCAIPQRLAAVPAARSGEARVLGLPNERFRIATPEGQAELDREVVAALERRRRALGLPDGAMVPALNLLAVSGGGENGAFGAGLLNGWTAHGTRPVFDLATGVSTGALTAPFAYLGPDWDEALKDVYTAITPDRVLTRRWLTAAVFDDGLADTSPLFETISHYLDERMLVAIADAYQQGRLLLIGTADIDAQTPVIWNIGAIAGSGHPRALDTVRRILLASAAIPGAFPPVMFDVTLDGKAHQEMHVDGGTFAQAFLYPSAVTSARRA